MQANVTNEHFCAICLNGDGNQVHHAREMMCGLRTPFQYLECSVCGCLQLMDPPVDLAPFYPDEYYSFKPRTSTLGWGSGIMDAVKKVRGEACLGRPSLLGDYLKAKFPRPELDAISRTAVDRHSRILDVGCGSGKLLLELRELGFMMLTGVDLFCPATTSPDGIDLRKGRVEDLLGTSWDLIMFHHSFEHIPNPVETLTVVRHLLAEKGECLIRIPVVGWAWQHYGVNWAQLDAPRHFFLHSEESMRRVANDAGLTIVNVEYDSTEYQFWGSELNAQDISLASIGSKSWEEMFNRKQAQDFREKARELNRQGRGDQAIFYLRSSSRNLES